jgi:hypothetical protein
MTVARRLLLSFSGVILIAAAWPTRLWSDAVAMSLVPVGVGLVAFALLFGRSTRMVTGLQVLGVTTIVAPLVLILGLDAAVRGATREAREESIRKHGREIARVSAELTAARVQELTRGRGRCPSASEIENDVWIRRDPWGRAFIIDCDLTPGRLRVISKGPDGTLDSEDDVRFQINESRLSIPE